MKHKVSDLTGPQLDAAVAMAQGWKRARVHDQLGQPWDHDSWCEGGDDANHAMHNADGPHAFAPSTAWSDGGPIIERERIMFSDLSDEEEVGNIRAAIARRYGSYWADGPTFVASKLGKEIEL